MVYLVALVAEELLELAELETLEVLLHLKEIQAEMAAHQRLLAEAAEVPASKETIIHLEVEMVVTDYFIQ
tara:strand:+ start:294 stop:503 length:210 start_codon:yes stop_codon:yes gene_type:complete